MARNKFIGKRSDYGHKEVTATVKVIYKGRVAAAFVEVMVLVLLDALQAVLKAIEDARKQVAIKSGRGAVTIASDDPVFDYDVTSTVSEKAIFKHKGFKQKAGGSYGGSKSHIVGVGQRLSKAELHEIFDSGDIETCLRVVVSQHIAKQLALRTKAALRAEAFAPGTGNKFWYDSGLAESHKLHWSIKTHKWMSTTRRAVVKTVFLIGTRLQAVAEANQAALAGGDGDDEGVHVDAAVGGSGSNTAVAVDGVGSAKGKGKSKNKGGNSNSGNSSNSIKGVGPPMLVWIPDEMWVMILQVLKRAYLGPLDDDGNINQHHHPPGGGGGGGGGSGYKGGGRQGKKGKGQHRGHNVDDGVGDSGGAAAESNYVDEDGGGGDGGGSKPRGRKGKKGRGGAATQHYSDEDHQDYGGGGGGGGGGGVAALLPSKSKRKGKKGKGKKGKRGGGNDCDGFDQSDDEGGGGGGGVGGGGGGGGGCGGVGGGGGGARKKMSKRELRLAREQELAGDGGGGGGGGGVSVDNADVKIPCEYCGKLVPLHTLETHQQQLECYPADSE